MSDRHACHADRQGPCLTECCPLQQRKPKPMIAWCPADHPAPEPDDFDPDEREPDAEAAYDPGHDCREHEEERSTHPNRAGAFTTWTECDLCGRQLSPTLRDSLL